MTSWVLIHLTRSAQMIMALHLLHRARQLQSQPVEGTSPFTPLPPVTSLRNSRFDHPRAYQDILDAALALERAMPDRAEGRVFDPSSTADTEAISIVSADVVPTLPG